ncbi:nucleotide sugar dehydrogenase [Alphaproteobacteria bacterium]|nr:nucleotide sugar dehydrogenase [Alphaproteobacteria bacterium]
MIDKRIAVIGLGYVGLPLAVEFGKYFPTIGFDINAQRIDQLNSCVDQTNELISEEISQATKLEFSSDPAKLENIDVFIVAVPTPVDADKQPDLTALKSASHTVGSYIKSGGVAIFESTVFPGATEEVCVPILEEMSGLTANDDFGVGYSPERINPGDKEHRLSDVVKVTAGGDPETAASVASLYGKIVKAGVHQAPSIKVAETAKLIENAQRDLNIALMNELSLICDKLDIDTLEVIDAASTKWNFMRFTPGLVGGHCIGVDPYYLTHKALDMGYTPEVVLAGRRINDSMGIKLAENVLNLLKQKNIDADSAKILLLGLAFKENCPDLRNSKVLDIYNFLRDHVETIQVHDAVADANLVETIFTKPVRMEHVNVGSMDAIIIATPHDSYVKLGAEHITSLLKSPGVFVDVKGAFDKSFSDMRL